MRDLTVASVECEGEAAQRSAGWQAVMPEMPPCRDRSQPTVAVYDHVLSDFANYRQWVLAQPFGDVTVGPVTFHGLAAVGRTELADAVKRIRRDCQPTLTFARQSPAGQLEPNYIHTDVDMGAWTGIFYLNDPAVQGDGTKFWKLTETGATLTQAQTPAESSAEALAWRDPVRWTCWKQVVAVPNRLVWFDARAFHSRAIQENYGHGTSSRLIQVIFGV